MINKYLDGLKLEFLNYYKRLGIFSIVLTIVVFILFLYKNTEDIGFWEKGLYLLIILVAILLIQALIGMFFYSFNYLFKDSVVVATISFMFGLVILALIIFVIIFNYIPIFLQLFKVENPNQYTDEIITIVGILVTALIPVGLTLYTINENNKQSRIDRDLSVKPLLRFGTEVEYKDINKAVNEYKLDFTSTDNKTDFDYYPGIFSSINMTERIISRFEIRLVNFFVKNQSGLYSKNMDVSLSGDERIVSLYQNEIIVFSGKIPVASFFCKNESAILDEQFYVELIFEITVNDINSKKYKQDVRLNLKYIPNYNDPKISLSVLSEFKDC